MSYRAATQPPSFAGAPDGRVGLAVGKGRSRAGAAGAAACLLALAGCVVPRESIECITEVYADVSDERLVLVVNRFSVNEWGHRFAVYRSARGDPIRWRLLGTYSGRARGAAVRLSADPPDVPPNAPDKAQAGPRATGTELWILFADGSARTYPLGEGGSAGAPPGDGPGRVQGEIADFPFDWRPLTICGDGEGGLWAVGVNELETPARITSAHLGPGEKATWQHSFPAGPVVKELEPERTGPGSRSRRPRRAAGRLDPRAGDGSSGPAVRVRACVSGDLCVFWSVVLPGGDPAERVFAARLHPGSDSRVARWTELPSLVFAHDYFCAAPTADGTPGVVLQRYASGQDEGDEHGPMRAELDQSGERWRAPEVLAGTSARFLFGYVPSAAWVRWEGGELLLRSNTQRVEIARHRDGRWEILRAASRLALILPEIWVLVFGAGGLVLVVVGGAVLAVRMARFSGVGRAKTPMGQQMGRAPTSAVAGDEDAPGADTRLAPITHRAVAAAFDVFIVDGVVALFVRYRETLANPLVPEIRPLVAVGVVFAILTVYATVMEAVFGATVGKFALGLRVESGDGGKPSLRQVILRNLLRPVDLLPPYLGAIGLSAMTVTAGRRRLGDLAAGTLVVRAAPDEEKP